MTTHDERPWKQLARILHGGEEGELERFVEDQTPADLARSIAHVGADEAAEILRILPCEDAADLLEALPDAQAADLIEHLEAEEAAPIVHEMVSDEQVDLIAEIEVEEAEAILAEFQPAEAAEIRALAAYAPDSAGGLMFTEVVQFQDRSTVAEVLDAFRVRAAEYADFLIQYTYVVDAARRLVGVLRVRDLLFSSPRLRLPEIMIPDPISVHANTPLEELASQFGRTPLMGLPVVDSDHVLLGVVLRRAVDEAAVERAQSDHLKSQGITSGEELRSMPVRERVRRRLSWLSLNVILNFIAASVIAAYEETLSAVIALAVFLPIISDMSGCCGNQAVAVTMRELASGLIKPSEAAYVWLKEMSVGLVNGLVLGGMLGGAAFLWKGNAYLGLVVGVALALNTVLAVSLGGTIPLLLKRFGRDPALASGPILTTVTDLCGFLLVLAFATAMLGRLV